MPEIQEMLHLKDLWDEQRARELGDNQLAFAALSLELAWSRPANHELWRRKYQFEIRVAGSFYR